MFASEFFPTPAEVISQMTEGLQIADRVFLEPSAGAGGIVEHLNAGGASQVLACETDDDLRKIVQTKCSILAHDFFTVTSEQISHINAIVMNPPFSNADKHILHAWDIAPAGCKIVALCNTQTIENDYSQDRRRLKSIISESGHVQDLGTCFDNAARKTGVNVSMIELQKPGANYESEFEGFFMDDEPEEKTGAGLMPYNVVRDIVNRYVAAVKIFDEQLEAAEKMSTLTAGFFSSSIALSFTENEKPVKRNEFKKAMQKAGWSFIFQKMDMAKYATKGLREDINKFVEQQQQIPFTMKNI